MSREKLTDILNNILNDQQDVKNSITVDAMKPFVCATYDLEGDGSLAPTAYQNISKLQSTIACEHYVMALAKHESNGNSNHKQQLVRYAKGCVQPANEYFKAKFDLAFGELKDTVLSLEQLVILSLQS